jgi:lactate permease
MLWAVSYSQHLDPLSRFSFPWSPLWSTLLAAVPVVLLFYLLVFRRWPAPRAGAAAALSAFVIACLAYGMPPLMAGMAFVNGVGFGLLPVGWTVFSAMLLYNITVRTGKFDLVRRSVSSLSGDARLQAVLIGFAFGAFLEGAAGAGTPVAICGAILVGLGFDPFLAAVLCLIANTSPVAYGGLGTPLITLSGVTDIRTETLSTMAGHQLPLISVVLPLYMVRCMCSWRKTLEVWPALLVGGGSFALFQFFCATSHNYIPLTLYPMTDIGGGIFSLIVTAIFLRFWKPKKEWHFDKQPDAVPAPVAPARGPDPHDAHAAAALAMLGEQEKAKAGMTEPALNWKTVGVAWMPFALMSVFLMLSGLLRQAEGNGAVYIGPVRTNYMIPDLVLDFLARRKVYSPVRTNYMIPVPMLHNETERDDDLHPIKTIHSDLKPFKTPLGAPAALGCQVKKLGPMPEKAEFNFAWLSSPGTAVFLAALLSMVLLRMSWPDIRHVLWLTCRQMRVPIPTIAFMLGLSYITRYAGMDATLGVFFAKTGAAYPFFAAILGWMGVFLTGTDAGSNALFGSLQKITATKVHQMGVIPQLTLSQAQVLICTANSTGGVMGKMIDAQSIVVATAATHQVGREADIFKAVLKHSIILACVVGALVLLQAYVWPFTLLVPGVK